MVVDLHASYILSYGVIAVVSLIRNQNINKP